MHAKASLSRDGNQEPGGSFHHLPLKQGSDKHERHERHGRLTSQKPLQQCVSQVRIFDYCIHVCNAGLEGKLGSCFVFRRGAKPYTLVAWLVHSGEILNLLSNVLSELLQAYEIRLARLTTKAAKIRRLMALEEVTEKCDPADIQRVEAVLVEQEQKRNSKKDIENEESELKENNEESIRVFCSCL